MDERKERVLNVLTCEMKRQQWRIEFKEFDLEKMADEIILAVS